MPLVELIPNGLCRCGCGEPVYTRKYVSKRPGKPNYSYKTYEFCIGHNQRVPSNSSGTFPLNSWPRRKDTVDPAPIWKLVQERRHRYGTTIAAMENRMGVHWLHNMKHYQYMTKPIATRVLNLLSEHYPYKGYVPEKGELVVAPKTTAFNYVTPKPTNIRFHPNDPDWGQRAACRGMPLTPFFPSQPLPLEPMNSVRNICARCPVADDCFGTALSFGEEHGVWGGVWFGSKKEREFALETYNKTHNMAKTRATVVKFARVSYANREK